MKLVLLLLSIECLLGVLCNDGNIPSDKEIEKVEVRCTEESGIKAETSKKSETYKKYNMCLMKGFDIINEKGEFNKERFMMLFLDEKAESKKSVDECLDKQKNVTDVEEKVHQLRLCLDTL